MLARRRAGCQLVLCLEISIDDATTTASFVTSCWLATPREGQGVTGERQRHSHQPQPCRAVAGLAERPSTTSHRGAVACTTRSSGRRPPRRRPAAAGGGRARALRGARALERGRLVLSSSPGDYVCALVPHAVRQRLDELQHHGTARHGPQVGGPINVTRQDNGGRTATAAAARTAQSLLVLQRHDRSCRRRHDRKATRQ